MAVRLTKEPVLREYTPIHLIDEEDTIQKSKQNIKAKVEIGTKQALEIVPIKGEISDAEENINSNVEIIDVEKAMNIVQQYIGQADESVKHKFCEEFMPQMIREKERLKEKKDATDFKFILTNLLYFCVCGLLMCAVYFCGDNVIEGIIQGVADEILVSNIKSVWTYMKPMIQGVIALFSILFSFRTAAKLINR